MLDFLADDVEADGLGQGSALADGYDVTDSKSEGWGAVGGDGLVALFEPIVLNDVVEVVATNDNGVFHLVRDDDTSKYKLDYI